MKVKRILSILTVLALSAMLGLAQGAEKKDKEKGPEGGPAAGPGGPGGPMGPMGRMNFFAEWKEKDGSVKIEDFMTKLAEEFKKADADSDGVLSEEEIKKSDAARAIFGGFGGPGFGPFGKNPMEAAMNEKGEIVLAKLPEEMPDQFRDALINADKDLDGVLSKKEQKTLPMFNQRPGRGPRSDMPKK